MKVLITGATGFIGSEIVSELADKQFDIYRIGRSNINSDFNRENFFQVDITNIEDVKALKKLNEVDAVIHSAGLAHQFGNIGREKFQKTNVEGTRNILRLAVMLKVRHFILISSTAVYGTDKRTRENVGATGENAACRPQTFYADSKLKAEESATEVCGQNNIDLTIFRLAPVIGEGGAGNSRRLIEAIDKGHFVWIGKGKNLKSLIYKKDVAKACRKILTEKRNRGVEIFNLAAAPVLMRDFVSGAADKLDKRIPKLSISPKILEKFFRLNEKTLRLGKLQKISITVEKWLSDDVYSAEKFEREYDFKPETSVPAAMGKQISHYRKQKEIAGKK